MLSVPDLRRLALIGDSVFAVSITLNARAVTIPRLGASGFDSPAFGTFVEGVISVLLSVVVACLFWLAARIFSSSQKLLWRFRAPR